MKKRKETWKSCICAVLVTAFILTMLPGKAYAAQRPEWRYGDSLQVSVWVDEARTFSPEDFPGIDCKKVFVLRMSGKQEGGYYYSLVLLLNEARSMNTSDYEKVIYKVRELPMVTWAAQNYEYVPRGNAQLKLNESYLYLAVGKTKDVFVDYVNYGSDRNLIYGIKFEPDSEYFDLDALQKDSFSEYGISRFWPDMDGKKERILEVKSRPEEYEAKKSESGYYYGLVGEENEQLFDVVARLSVTPGIKSVCIVGVQTVGAASDTIGWDRDSANAVSNKYNEWWSIGNETISDYVLSGNGIYKTATVQGLKSGVTVLTCERGEYDAYIATTCPVIVYEPGSTNNPGDLNHDGRVSAEDALKTLKQTIGTESLGDSEMQAADLDGNGKVNANDALLMLKIAVESMEYCKTNVN